jgi:hypothetical protein
MMNNELERIWKEAVMVLSGHFFWDFPRELEETRKILSHDRL